MTKVLTAIVVFLAAIMPVQVFGQGTSTKYADVGGWTVFKNDRGCYMVGGYEDDIVLSVFIGSRDDAEFWVQSPRWRSLQEGSTQNISVKFDNEEPWGIKAKVRVDDDGPGLSWMGGIAPDEDGNTFFGEFMAGKAMTINYKGSLVARLNLTDTYKAGLKLAECSSEVKRDPFVGGATRDPFRN